MLAISLLGRPQFTLDSNPVTGFVSHKASALLAYLAVESEQPHGRATLANLLWPDQNEKVALKNLRDILFNLQKLLHNQTATPPYLIISRQTVQFNPTSNYNLDIADFFHLVTTNEAHRHKNMETCRSCAHRGHQAIASYRGDFLSGIFVEHSNEYERWLTLNRERCQQMVLASLGQLTRFHARRREFAYARQFAQRQVEIAPWLETGYRQLMILAALAGQRGAALAYFETCRQRLATELNVTPGPETLKLYEQIKGGERPSPTPSLPAIPEPSHKLPGQSTIFLGREQELLEIADYLQVPSCRLLTLVGPGGSGKTRLALQVAADETASFDQGVFFVPLTAVKTPESLLLALAEGLDFKLVGNKPPESQLLNYLRNKELLLVLDNFENLLGNGCAAQAAEFLTAIIKEAPHVVLLITSRQPVGLQAERLFDLDGLSFPDASVTSHFERCEAVQLFLERVRRIRPRFKPMPEVMTAVAEICRVTEGLPLGIELAAASARNMTCSEILSGMKQSLDALATEMSDIPARHRSLRATFTYSWKMLSLVEQKAFCDLSVFRGGFSTEAIHSDPNSLAALVDKSLIHREENGRYHIHELLRQFGEEQLRQNPEAEKSARDIHSDWVATFLEKRGPHLQGKDQLAALSQIRDEIENVRAGWQWAVEQKNESHIRRGMMTLSLFYDIRGWFQEGLEVFRAASGQFSGTGAFYGRLLSYYAAFNYRLGKYELAQEQYQKCLTIFSNNQINDQKAFIYNGLGAIAMFRGQYGEAKEHALKSLTIGKEAGNLYEQAKSLDMLGVIARYEGRLDEARPYLQASIDIYEEMGNQFGLARSYNYLGNLAVSEKEYKTAREIFQKAIAISRKLDYKYLLAYLLNNMANVTSLLDNHQEGLKSFEESLNLFKDIGDQFGMAMAENNLGYMYLLLEQGERSKKHLQSAIRTGLTMPSGALILEAVTSVAILLSQTGQATEAATLASCVIQHPTARDETKQKAKTLLSEINLPEAADFDQDSLTLEELSEIALRVLSA